MELRGRELFDLFSQFYDVALLEHRMLTIGSTGVELSPPDWDLTPISAGVRVRLMRRWRWVGAGARFTTVGRRRLRAILSAYRPDLVFLLKFKALHPAVLYELLACPAPIVVRFGDCHSMRLPEVIRGIPAAESMRRTLLPLPRPPRDVCNRMMLVFNCNFVRDFYLRRFPPVAYRVVYTGVDTARFRPAPVPVESNRFVFLGRTTRAKGFLEFCRAMVALPRALVDSIEILGTGTELEAGLEILRAGGRSDLIGHAGLVPHEAVAEHLRAASTLVQPTDDDVLPASVLEAMSSGLGVVATNITGLPEIVRHEETGLLVRPHDEEDLVRACRRLAERPDVRRRLGQEARRLVVTRHQASDWLAANRAIVTEMMTKHPGRVSAASPMSGETR
jgi:glycosyltransferase involved in cell wall biosynthesis